MLNEAVPMRFPWQKTKSSSNQTSLSSIISPNSFVLPTTPDSIWIEILSYLEIEDFKKTAAILLKSRLTRESLQASSNFWILAIQRILSSNYNPAIQENPRNYFISTESKLAEKLKNLNETKKLSVAVFADLLVFLDKNKLDNFLYKTIEEKNDFLTNLSAQEALDFLDSLITKKASLAFRMVMRHYTRSVKMLGFWKNKAFAVNVDEDKLARKIIKEVFTKGTSDMMEVSLMQLAKIHSAVRKVYSRFLPYIDHALSFIPSHMLEELSSLSLLLIAHYGSNELKPLAREQFLSRSIKEQSLAFQEILNYKLHSVIDKLVQNKVLTADKLPLYVNYEIESLGKLIINQKEPSIRDAAVTIVFSERGVDARGQLFTKLENAMLKQTIIEFFKKQLIKPMDIYSTTSNETYYEHLERRGFNDSFELCKLVNQQMLQQHVNTIADLNKTLAEREKTIQALEKKINGALDEAVENVSQSLDRLIQEVNSLVVAPTKQI